MKRSKVTNWFFNLFYLYLILLPLTNVKIPVGEFGFTFADAVLMVLLFLLIFIKDKKRHLGRMLLALFALFFMGLALSIFGAKYYAAFIVGIIPFIYIGFLLFVIVFISGHFTDRDLTKTKRAIAISLLLSYLPLYMSLIGVGIPDIFFMGEGFVKYRYLCAVSNQYNMYVFALVSLTIFLSLKYYRKIKIMDFVITILSILPILYSGSRSGTILVGLILIVMLFISFFTQTIRRKLVFIGLLLIIGTQMAKLDFADMNWNIVRALSFLEMYEKKGVGVDEWREKQYSEAIDHFYESPIYGLGIGNYGHVTTHEVHNTFISLLVETGLFGLSAYLLLLGCIIIFAIRNANSRMLVIYILFFTVLYLSANYSALLVRERWMWVLLFLLGSLKNFETPTQLEIKSSD